jgi:hypothetical protein
MDYSHIKAGAAGKVGQVVYATETDAQSVASASYVDMSGMTITITPTATDSKVLILGSAVIGNSSQYSYFQIVYGDGTALTTQAVGDTRGSRVASTGGSLYSSHSDSNTMIGTSSIVLLDAPATTSATTYKLQVRLSSGSSTIYLNRSTNDPDSTTGWSAISTLVAMEILA